MRHATLFLFGCFLALIISFPNTASADEGEFRIGLAGEYFNDNPGDGGSTVYGDRYGFVAGYKNTLGTDYWYDVSGKYLHGKENGTGGGTFRESNFRFLGKIGTTYDYDIAVKPFIGLGINYSMWDEIGGKDSYLTDYILPVGLLLEKETSYGLVSTDFQYEYVVHREIYVTDTGETGQTSTFGGSSNAELGIKFEPKNMPIGFRPYYRYEHWAKKDGGWSANNVNIGGLEVYYRF